MSTLILLDVALLVTLMILGVPVAMTFVAAAAFQRETSDLLKEANGLNKELERARDRLRH